jgi:hypothetical protein
VAAVVWLALTSAFAGCAHDTIPPSPAEVGGDDASAPALPEASSDGSSPASDAAADALTMVSGFDGASGIEGGVPADPNCDLNGRWLIAQRVLADALGQQQASHNWFYYELRQDGTSVTVTKGLHCGYEVKHVTVLGADVDTTAAWPALLAHDSDAGRAGTVQSAGGMCQVGFEKRYTVRGATLPFYADPNQPMPTAAQMATGSMPGWEDWDHDGHPGVTLTVSHAANGHIYCAQRDWNQYSGAIAQGATSFKLGVTWDSGQDVLGYDGSPLITESGTPDADPSQHYVWFVRLAPSQVTGDDAAICAAVRALVPSVAPTALE